MPRPLPHHVQWLATHRGRALEHCLGRAGVDCSVEDALGILMDADPSPGHHAVQWLCDTLIEGGYRWEDVAGGEGSKAAETLRWFSQHRRALPRGSRNLEDYRDLAGLYRAVQPYLDAPETDLPSGRELRRQVRAQAYRDSIILCARPDLVVAVPLGVEAARWWGLGTRWCTAADGHNMFHYYDKEAPLLVVVMPDVASNEGELQGGKLQLHMSRDGDVQFMDAADAPVSHEFVWEHWGTLGPLVLWAAARCGDMLAYVPESFRDHHLCLAAVRAHGRALKWVPEHVRSAQIYLDAVRSDPTAIHLVPHEYMSPELCMLAVSYRKEHLQVIPANRQNAAICLAAVEANGFNLEHVARKSARICRAAIEQNPYAIGFVPPRYRDHELCLAAVKSAGNTVRYVPGKVLDYQICLAAILQDPEAINHVPRDMQTPRLIAECAPGQPRIMAYIEPRQQDADVVRDVVLRDPMLMRYIGPEHKTADICMAAVLDKPHSFGCIDYGARTPELCRIAVSGYGRNLCHVPLEYRTHEICRIAVENDVLALSYVPAHHLDQEMCNLVIGGLTGQCRDYSSKVLSLFPQDFRDRNACMVCLASNTAVLADVPPGLLDEGMYRAAVWVNPRAILDVPPESRTTELWMLACARGQAESMILEAMPALLQVEEFCTAAVTKKGALLQHVRPDLRTPDLCAHALRSDPNAIEFMPAHLRGHPLLVAARMQGRRWTPQSALEGLAQALAAPIPDQVLDAIGRQVDGSPDPSGHNSSAHDMTRTA